MGFHLNAMRITFVTPHGGMSGGMRIIVAYAKMLHEFGHEVTIVSRPWIPRPKTRLEKFLTRTGMRAPGQKEPRSVYLDSFGGTHIEIETMRSIRAEDVPDGDLIFATWWETAEWVNAMPERKGRKAYLIQDYETFVHLPVDRVIATYGFDMRKIAVSDYIRRQVASHLPEGSEIAVISNAIDLHQFQAPERQKPDPPCIGFLYTIAERKNVALALRALALARQKRPDLQVRSFGSKEPHPDLPLPDWVEYQRRPPQERIAEIYAACSAWLLTSRHEGFGLPILEAMACRTPVLSTDAGAAPDLINGQNGRIQPHEASAFADAILELADMPCDVWRTMSDAAYDTARQHNWQDATERLLKAALG
ncbi:MAG: glycosyltransferase family 4 protein [Pseudomonadota bacterium]